MQARYLTSLLLVAMGDPVTAAQPRAEPVPWPDVVRGMTVSCQTWGREWGTDDMTEALRELKPIGVNWVTIHPYAGIRGDGTVVMPPGWYAEATWLKRPIKEAHRLGLKIMIKPHLAYWASPFQWRGDIEFADESQWQRFFDRYEKWMNRVAEICADADAFVVGTELDRTLHRDQQWRQVITSLRARFNGPITYSANWSKYEKVTFWDALDVIGIQAYFPVMNRPGLPQMQDLATSWGKWMKRLGAFSKDHDRRVLFGELGYNLSPDTAQRPWGGGTGKGSPLAEQIQRRCLAAALSAIDADDRVIGAFLWKWFPGRTTHEDFLMSTPAMRQVIADHWSQD